MKSSSRSNIPGTGRDHSITPYSSRMSSSIPKYKQPGSSVLPKKPKNTNVVRKRSSAEKFSRISLASNKLTPNKFTTPKQNNCLSAVSHNSRASINTVRSSFGGKGGQEGWPLTDPSFKTKCIDKVLDFLIANKYEHPLNRNILRTPTKKDFTQIFCFIFQHINPAYTLPVRFEEDIPKLLKGYKYPVQMPKSSFLNVGSPHTWPSVLAMLVWFIDLIVFYNTVSYTDLSSKDFDDDSTNFTLKKLHFCVAGFHSDDKDEINEHVADYKAALEENQDPSDTNLEELQLELDRLTSQLNNPSCVKDQLLMCQRHYAELNEDKEKLLKFNNELKLHISAKNSERTQMDSNLVALKEEYQQVLAEIERYETLKEGQHYSVSELKRFKNNKEEIANQINHLQDERKVLNEQMWALEMETSKARKVLSEEIFKYNSLCTSLQFESCRLSTVNLEQQEIESWEEEIPAFIQAEKKKVKEEQFHVQASLVSLKKDRDQIKESLNAKKSNRHKLECKVKRREEELACLKTDKSQEEKEVQKECERLAQMVSEARRAPKSNLYEKQRQLNEAKERLEALKIRDKELREKGAKFLNHQKTVLDRILEERASFRRDHNKRMHKLVS